LDPSRGGSMLKKILESLREKKNTFLTYKKVGKSFFVFRMNEDGQEDVILMSGYRGHKTYEEAVKLMRVIAKESGEEARDEKGAIHLS